MDGDGWKSGRPYGKFVVIKLLHDNKMNTTICLDVWMFAER